MVTSSDTQVQGSNDWSIASKLSMVNAGYYSDPMLKYFVHKTSRRSALIHRGYYVRAKAMDKLFSTFVSVFLEKSGCYEQVQLVSLGAGFDSSFFRLNQTSKDTITKVKYVELDFPDVVKRKWEIINNHEDLLSSTNQSNYHLVPADLRNLKDLEKLLKETLKLDPDLPTLFVSECSITYMDEPSSSRLIHWCGNNFSNAVFAVYEQIEPNDSFGHVMQQHFIKLGIPLLSLPVYPSKDLQRTRYLEKGWSSCKVVDMNQFYYECIPREERLGIETLEPFDEYEGFHWKCAHYILLTAANGDGVSLLNKMWSPIPEDQSAALKSCEKLKWKLKNCNVERYGQAGTSAEGVVWLSGGFGTRPKLGHGRLGNLLRIHLSPGVEVIDGEVTITDKRLSRMHHTMSYLKSQNLLIIYGGRFSPGVLPAEVLVVECCLTPVLRELEVSTSGPQPRWRHAAVTVKINGKEGLFVCGGRDASQVFSDCWFLNLESDKAVWVPMPSLPARVHSHAAVCPRPGRIVVAGGLSSSEEALNDIYTIDLNEADPKWEKIFLSKSELLPRYSHQAVVLGSEKIALVGGVASQTNCWPGVAIIDLESGECVEHKLPDQDPNKPILLVGHTVSKVAESSVVCIGGGSACFSFGTHINMHSVVIEL